MSRIQTKFIASNAVTNAKLATMAANTIKANATGSSASPTDVTLSSNLQFIGSILDTIQAIQTTSSPTFSAINLKTGAIVNYVWTCTNATTGAGSWQVGGSTPATSTTAGTIPRYTNWTAYTPTYTGFGSVLNNSAFYKVIGDSLFIRGSITSGTRTAVLGTISIPGAFTINSSALSLNNTSGNAGNLVGTYGGVAAVSNVNSGAILTAPATSTSLLYVGQTVTSTGSIIIPTNATNAGENGMIWAFECEVPIV